MVYENKLNIMKQWLFGTTAAVFAAMSALISSALGAGLRIVGMPQFWFSLALSAGLAALWHSLYRAYLQRFE
jgi:hypothetical protein